MTRDGGAAECRDSPGSRENSKEGAGLTAFAAEEERFPQGWDQVSRLICACACAMRTFPCTAFCSNMEFRSARQAILQLLRTVAPADLPVLLEWMRTTRKRPRARGRRLGQGYVGDLGSGQKPSMESLCWSLFYRGRLTRVHLKPWQVQGPVGIWCRKIRCRFWVVCDCAVDIRQAAKASLCLTPYLKGKKRRG